MEKQVLYNFDMDFEHEQWKEEIAFWSDGLKSFCNKLSEFITRWPNKELHTQIGHFQNQFILHADVLEDLLETIEKHERHISGQRKAGVLSMDAELSKKHIEFGNQMEKERETYDELKNEFFKFLEMNS